MPALRSVGHVDDVLRLEPPALATSPDLALPDRDGRLEGVDPEPGGEERCCRGAERTPRRSPRTPRPGTGPTRWIITTRPRSSHRARASSSDRRQPWDDVLLVRLVLEDRHVGSTGAVVARRAAEQHDRAAVGPDGPRIGLADREVGVGEAPATRRRWDGGSSTSTMLVMVGRPVRRRPLRGTPMSPRNVIRPIVDILSHRGNRRERRGRRRVPPAPAAPGPPVAPSVGAGRPGRRRADLAGSPTVDGTRWPWGVALMSAVGRRARRVGAVARAGLRSPDHPGHQPCQQPAVHHRAPARDHRRRVGPRARGGGPAIGGRPLAGAERRAAQRLRLSRRRPPAHLGRPARCRRLAPRSTSRSPTGPAHGRFGARHRPGQRPGGRAHRRRGADLRSRRPRSTRSCRSATGSSSSATAPR